MFTFVALKVGLVSNLLPRQALKPAGPRWRVPFIFWFHLVFPLLHRARMARSGLFLVVAAGGGLAITALWREAVGTELNLYVGILPNLPEFCLGIALAGQRSLPLFLVNGYVRQPLLDRARESESGFVIILWTVAFLSIAVAAAVVLQKTESALRHVARRARLSHRVRG